MLQEIQKILEHLKQPHLSTGIEQLCSSELASFLKQLQQYPKKLLHEQKQLKHLAALFPSHKISPYTALNFSGNSLDSALGEKLIAEGKVGCLILAGGEGSRLGHTGPKGTISVTPITKKSLFQLFCEKTKKVSSQSGKLLPLCVMTSACNHTQTLDFFKSHHHFGLNPDQLFFFQQQMLPLLDEDFNWFLEKPGKVAEGPDGNGHALHHFFSSGIWQQWVNQGIEYLNVIFVDNVLADPFDPEIIGFTARQRLDASLKAVKRLSSQEKMGVLAEDGGKLKVIEYSELALNHSSYPYSSTGMFCLWMPFIFHLVAEIKAQMPLHLARKKAFVFKTEGCLSEKAEIWKCERFLFDLLNYTRSSAALICEREKIYCPLKNATGENSLETIHKTLPANDLYV